MNQSINKYIFHPKLLQKRIAGKHKKTEANRAPHCVCRYLSTSSTINKWSHNSSKLNEKFQAKRTPKHSSTKQIKIKEKKNQKRQNTRSISFMLLQQGRNKSYCCFAVVINKRGLHDIDILCNQMKFSQQKSRYMLTLIMINHVNYVIK